MRALLVALALALGFAAPVAAQDAEVVMSATRTELGVGETVDLQIRADVTNGSIDRVEPPDLSGFEIVGRRIANPMQFRFGFGNQTQVMQQTTVHAYTLRATTPGRHELPPARIVVGGRTFRSNPLSIVVNGGVAPGTQWSPAQPGQLGQPGQPGNDPVPPSGTLDGATFDPQAFLRTVVDRAEPYVGEQVTVTIYLYMRGPMRSSPTVTREATADGFWVHDLLPPQRNLDAVAQTVGGIPFRAYVLRRFAAFPLRDGTLTIGAPEVTVEPGSLFDIFGQGGGGPLARVGVPVSVNAKPLPAAGRPAGPIHVGRWALDARLDRTQVATGDAVTLTATVRGTGNIRDLRLEVPNVPGLRVLPPQTREQVEAPGDLVGGNRTWEWLVVPERPGEHRIPAFGFSAFNPATATYDPVMTPPLMVLAAGNAPGTTDEPRPDDAPAGDPTQTNEDDLRFGPVRTESELTRPSAPIADAFWYAPVTAIPPLAWLGFLVFGLIRRRLDARSAAEAPRRAVKHARKRLAEAERLAAAADARAFYSASAQALKTVIEARLGEPIGGLTHPQLRAHLKERGMAEDLANRVVDELEGTEFARFSAAGASREEMDHCLDRTQALLERLDRFTPKPKEDA